MKRFFVLCLSFVLFFTLSACDEISVDDIDSILVTNIEVDETTLPEDFLIGEVDFSNIRINVTRNDGTVDQIILNESMITSTDLERLLVPGTHTLEISYLGQSTTITITVKENVDEDPTDENPNDEDSADEDPTDENPNDEDSADEDSTDENPNGENPSDDNPNGYKPSDSPYNHPVSANIDPALMDALMAEDKITITMWNAYGNINNELLNDIVSGFNETYPNIEVIIESQWGYDNLREALIQSVVAQQMPNLFMGYSNHIHDIKMANSLLDLTPYLFDIQYGMPMDDFIQATLHSPHLYEEDFYTMPFHTSIDYIAYNKTLLENKGVVFEEETVLSWEDLELLSNTLLGNDETSCGYLLVVDSYHNLFVNTLLQENLHYVDSQFNLKLEDAAVIAQLERLIDVFNNDQITFPYTFGQTYGSLSFTSGQVCMMQGSHMGARHHVPQESTFEVGILPPLQSRSDQNIQIGNTVHFAITNDQTDIEALASYLLMKHLLSPESNAYFAAHTGYMPIRHSAFELAQAALDATSNPNPINVAMLPYLASQKDNLVFHPEFILGDIGYDQLRTGIAYYLELVLYDGITKEEAYDIVFGDNDTEQIIYTDFSQLHEEAILGDVIRVEGIVVGNFATGFILFDGAHFISLYAPSTVPVMPNSYVYVEGTYTSWQDIYQLSDIIMFEVLDFDMDYSFDYTPISVKDLTELDGHVNPLVGGAPYQITGVVEIKGDFANVYIVDGDDEVQIHYMSSQAFIDALKVLDGQTVTVDIYYYADHIIHGQSVIGLNGAQITLNE